MIGGWVTRGAESRDRPVSLLHDFAEEEGVPLEPNGFYVPPKDPEALHRAITFLLDNPSIGSGWAKPADGRLNS